MTLQSLLGCNCPIEFAYCETTLLSRPSSRLPSSQLKSLGCPIIVSIIALRPQASRPNSSRGDIKLTFVATEDAIAQNIQDEGAVSEFRLSEGRDVFDVHDIPSRVPHSFELASHFICGVVSLDLEHADEVWPVRRVPVVELVYLEVPAPRGDNQPVRVVGAEPRSGAR